ncbi:trypsin-like peptidase domain-containing protein [uncultured Paludibaculum sp.]|uniref:trypsin-like peptidase domain-containing protein n=1 Tax=uncultured Paludibaculum sp. TaxID=1765020 RepID=UPI002AAB31D7|nr:trypsin-like peptidase domain-containing protein [uncultured Paludibaculum sp.]
MRLLSALLLLQALMFGQARNPTLHGLNDELVALSNRLHPAIVLIRSEAFEPVSHEISLAVRQTGTGSGVILSEDGYIVTNAHVVGKSTTVEVLLAPAVGARSSPERNRLLEGKVLGRDTEADIALVKVDARGLRFLEWGDSEALKQGQLVLAIGNPRGLENSVTMGVISSTQRQLKPDDRMVYIQTDAAINPGNSGGALVDLDGKLIGINTMILSQSGGNEGLGFAVPARIANPVVEQLRKDGKVTRGDIGVTAQTLTYGIAQALGLKRETGVVVADVEPKSTGDIAGFKTGDIILSVDGRPMETARQFHVFIYRKPVASLIKIAVLRGETEMTLQPVVVDQNEKSPNLGRLALSEENLVRRMRVLGISLDDQLLKDLPPLRLNYGVIVAGLVPGALMQDDSLLPGDIIHALNGKPIATLQELKSLLAPIKSREEIVLQIERDGKTKFIEYRLE